MLKPWPLLGGLGLWLLITGTGCAALGGAGASTSEGSGVDKPFHDAFYRAQVAKLKGNAAGAREALLSCLDANPESPVIHFELARLDRQQEQWSSARSAIDQAILLDGNNPWYWKERAEIALETGDMEAADDALSWLLVNKPEDELSAQRLLDLRIAQGDVKGALEVVDVLEREWGPDPEWGFERHRLYMTAGDVEAALAALRTVERDFPDVVEATLAQARVLNAMGRVEEAETVLVQALDRTANGRLHLEWAHLLTQRGDTQQAREHVRIAFASAEVPMAEKESIAWTYVELAEIQPELREETQALIGLLQTNHPREPQPWDLASAFCLALGDAAGAMDNLREALNRDANSPDRWLEACQLSSELNLWKDVDELGESAGLRFPNLPVFPYFRGLAKLELNDDKGAERQLKMARNLIVDRPEFESDVLATLAHIEHDRGNHAASDDWFEMAIEAHPQNTLALNNYAYFLALRGAKPQRAVELGARAVRLSPGNANFEDTFAWALHQNGDHQEALTWIELALAHEGDQPSATVLEHAGDILSALGRTDEAKEKWQAALDAGGETIRIAPKLRGE